MVERYYVKEGFGVRIKSSSQQVPAPAWLLGLLRSRHLKKTKLPFSATWVFTQSTLQSSFTKMLWLDRPEAASVPGLEGGLAH